MEGKKICALVILLGLLNAGFCSASATAASSARIVGGFFSDALYSLLKRLWAMKPAIKTAVADRPMMRYESGYTVETVFDGSKLGIEPFAVEVSPSGELLVVDSVNSNLYRMSLPLSKYSRPKLVAGSAEGYTGHIDGRPREARMNHPKGLTMDDRGNIYVADTMNMAIRKIGETGERNGDSSLTFSFRVTTIAGGKSNRGGHIDGPSEDARFSNDFEVVYIGSSCSLLVVDRGNQAIREIQLNFDDCAYQYETGFPSGITVLLAAGFFGYMLALLQRRVGALISSKKVDRTSKASFSSPYLKPRITTVRTSLIPADSEYENLEQEEEGFFTSITTLVCGATSSMAEVFGQIFWGSRRKRHGHRYQSQYQQHRRPDTIMMQESFDIPEEDQPPPLETRITTPHKTYAFMSKEPEKIHHVRHGRPYFQGRDGEPRQQQMHQQNVQQHRHRQYSAGPQTYFEESSETTEIVFGAIQECDSKRRTVEIKAVNYGEPTYDQYGLRSRVSYNGYKQNY